MPKLQSKLPPKKQVALALLERSSVFIHLDPRDEGVRVPKWFKKQPQLVLRVGLNMAIRIPDLDIDERAISCTLSFNRSPHYCYLPWSAIYALVGEDGCGMVWPEDVPAEVAAQSEGANPAGPDVVREGPTRKRRSLNLAADPVTPPRRPSLVPIAAGSAPAGQDSRPRGAPREMPSYLRLVK